MINPYLPLPRFGSALLADCVFISFVTEITRGVVTISRALANSPMSLTWYLAREVLCVLLSGGGLAGGVDASVLCGFRLGKLELKTMGQWVFIYTW